MMLEIQVHFEIARKLLLEVLRLERKSDCGMDVTAQVAYEEHTQAKTFKKAKGQQQEQNTHTVF